MSHDDECRVLDLRSEESTPSLLLLFAGHDEGAQNLAILQPIVATCMLHAVNPYEYIRDVLVRIQTRGVTLDELMPWAWAPTAEAW